MATSSLPSASSVQPRSVVLVTPDADLRQRLSERLQSMRWRVLPASGGAEAMMHLTEAAPEAMIVDHWLPDLDAGEFAEYVAAIAPTTDLLQMNGSPVNGGGRSTRRHELLHALREAQEEIAPVLLPRRTEPGTWTEEPASEPSEMLRLPAAAPARSEPAPAPTVLQMGHRLASLPEVRMHLPEVVGDHSSMRELARMVRLVAPHTSTVLIQGATGTGKELIAKAVHRLSLRAGKPFVVLNCAAIPEQLLEAELFGHTRGAFTGAVTSRTGRIEAANGGTLFLDEIGEMPLPLQAKMLRFLENGEIQRVGDNDVSRVDVRIVAATHQPLEENAGHKLFRLDLYHRLATFPVDVPALCDRPEDIPMLTEFFLCRLGEGAPRRSIDESALSKLMRHTWPGNVRELSHVLQRAVILCAEESTIREDHLRIRSSLRAA